jgi:hypothetical protein
LSGDERQSIVDGTAEQEVVAVREPHLDPVADMSGDGIVGPAVADPQAKPARSPTINDLGVLGEHAHQGCRVGGGQGSRRRALAVPRRVAGRGCSGSATSGKWANRSSRCPLQAAT